MKIGLSIVCLFFCFWAQAQVAYVFTEKDSMMVGDSIEVKLILSGYSPEDVLEVNWDTLANLEFTNAADTANYSIDFDWNSDDFFGEDFIYNSDELKWNYTEGSSPREIYCSFSMTIWEMCGFRIPPPIITLVSGDTIDVGSRGLLVYSPFFEEMNTEKVSSFGIDSEQKKIWDYLLDFWWIIALILGIIATLFIRKKLKSRPAKEVLPPPLPKRKIIVIPPDVVALKKLKGLKESRKWETEGEKIYVSELTDIIREYIENRFEVQALEMTSTEILEEMKGDFLNEIQLEQLSNTLNVADMIKFAKSKADASLHEKFVDDAIDMVESSKEKPAEDVE